MDKGLSLNEKIQSLAKKLMAKYIEGSKPDNEELIQECKELTKKVLKKLGEEPETKESETDEEGPWKFKCPECGTTALFSNPWTKRICPSCGKEMVVASKEKGPKEDVGFGSPVPSHVFDLVHRRLSKIGQAVKLSPNNYLYKTPHGNIALNLLTGNWKHVRGTEVVNQ
jgi:ribosomal protein S27E